MPVKMGDKTYKSHDTAVKAIKKKKPGIKNADAYVASIERNQKKGKGKSKK